MIDEKKFMEFMTALEDAGAEHVSFDDLRKFIDEQPKVGEWIPCEKELPKKTAFYEVTTYCQSLGEYITDIADFVYTGFPEDKGGSGHFNCDDVIAWRPLPEPYKEVTHD